MLAVRNVGRAHPTPHERLAEDTAQQRAHRALLRYWEAADIADSLWEQCDEVQAARTNARAEVRGWLLLDLLVTGSNPDGLRRWKRSIFRFLGGDIERLPGPSTPLAQSRK